MTDGVGRLDGYALAVEDLRKSYKDVRAVDGISFVVERGEVFGILGPNGAGKTTTLEMIEGLRRPDHGQIWVEGIPSWPDPRHVKPLVGVQLQSTALFDNLTVREMLKLFASFYNLYPPASEVTALLERVGLLEKDRAQVRQLSGGQQQRLSIALALVNKPRVVFLDEPTTGLDPQARRRLWDVVREIHRDGITVILTTHYMEEAQVLCDRVAIMDNGRIIAIGSPDALVRDLESCSTIAFTSLPAFPAGVLEDMVTVRSIRREDGAGEGGGGENGGGEPGESDCGDLQAEVDADSHASYVITTEDVEGTLFRVVDRARRLNIRISDLQVSGPTLEDVFLSLTGHGLRD